MRILQNKVVVGGVCIVVAALFSFVLLPRINKGKSETEKVIKVNTDVPAGTQITDEMVTEVEVGKYGLSENVVRDKKQIVGKYTKISLTPEDIIMLSRFSEHIADEKLDRIVSDGKKLVTVTISTVASGVGNNLKSGDFVSVYYYADDEVNALDELRDIEVYSVQNSKGVNLEKTNEEDEKIACSITLIVDDVQAEKLVAAEYTGKIHTVLVKRGGR